MNNPSKEWLIDHAEEVLREIGIKEDEIILDFGCGSGTYTIPAAKLVGEKGLVYAVDKDKKELDNLIYKAKSAGLNNIKEIENMNFYYENEYKNILNFRKKGRK